MDYRMFIVAAGLILCALVGLSAWVYFLSLIVWGY